MVPPVVPSEDQRSSLLMRPVCQVTFAGGRLDEVLLTALVLSEDHAGPAGHVGVLCGQYERSRGAVASVAVVVNGLGDPEAHSTHVVETQGCGSFVTVKCVDVEPVVD